MTPVSGARVKKLPDKDPNWSGRPAPEQGAGTGDLKIGRRGTKAPLHWIPMWALKGVSRVFDYGARKYAPGNWVKAAKEPEPEEKALCDYLAAAQRHWAAIQDCEGGVAHWQALDEESGLPHLDHLICGLIMARGIAIKAGVLQGDPGPGREPV